MQTGDSQNGCCCLLWEPLHLGLTARALLPAKRALVTTESPSLVNCDRSHNAPVEAPACIPPCRGT